MSKGKAAVVGSSDDDNPGSPVFQGYTGNSIDTRPIKGTGLPTNNRQLDNLSTPVSEVFTGTTAIGNLDYSVNTLSFDVTIDNGDVQAVLLNQAYADIPALIAGWASQVAGAVISLTGTNEVITTSDNDLLPSAVDITNVVVGATAVDIATGTVTTNGTTYADASNLYAHVADDNITEVVFTFFMSDGVSVVPPGAVVKWVPDELNEASRLAVFAAVNGALEKIDYEIINLDDGLTVRIPLAGYLTDIAFLPNIAGLSVHSRNQ